MGCDYDWWEKKNLLLGNNHVDVVDFGVGVSDDMSCSYLAEFRMAEFSRILPFFF